MSMRTIAVCNQKGGVGKTITTYHLAWALAERGVRVLVVDADPQGNATDALAAARVPEDALGLADVLVGDAALGEVIVTGLWNGVDLVPTTGDALAIARDRIFVDVVGRELHLADALASVQRRYDVVLIDCPPSLDMLTINALTAASSVIVVSHAKEWSLKGLARLLGTIDRVRAATNPALSVEGILINLAETSTLSGAYWAGELDRFATETGTRLFATVIPKRVAISDSAESGLSLVQAGHNNLARLYRGLAMEVTHEQQ